MGDLGGQKHHSGRGSPQHKRTKSTSLSLSLGKTPETHSTLVSSASAALSVPTLSSPPSLMRFVLFILPFCCFYLCSGVCSYPSLRSSSPPSWPQTGQTTASIRGVYIKGFSGGLTLVLAKLDTMLSICLRVKLFGLAHINTWFVV